MIYVNALVLSPRHAPSPTKVSNGCYAVSNKKAGPKSIRLSKGWVVVLQSKAEEEIWLRRVWAWRDMSVKIIETW